MAARVPATRPSHPCLERSCGHGATDHLATPELAGGGESVVWCTRCHRHEVRRPSWTSAFRWGRRSRDEPGGPGNT